MADRPASFLQLIRRDRRGRLKVYLGYAAGVGKTWQMLQEAHRLRAESIDVAIGAVETHGRVETDALCEGLERIPPRRGEFRGLPVEEMDLEAVLARRPQVVLVDELAHANAPGGRNTRRYQDVEDLLAAGINVIATLDVQHLESLYDIVERATGVKVRERLPDAVLAGADEVVNVDISPEDLRKRLEAGRIVPPDRVAAALQARYRPAELEQLRELTLREAASHIDIRRREAAREGAGGDQVMACLEPGASGNAALLRYASRLAGRLNRNWYAVIVEALEAGADGTGRGVDAGLLALANRLGATVFHLRAGDPAEALSGFAREYHVGHMVVGHPRPRPWWRDWGRKGVVARLLGRGGGFHLIVIDAGESGGESIPEAAPIPERWRLTAHLRPEQILIWNEPLTKFQAMKALARTLERRSSVRCDWFVGRLLERESAGSTFLNEGVALPHARIEGLEKPLVAIGLSHGGILDAYTEKPIEVVFLLLSPKEENRSHLQLLAVAGRLFLSRTLRNRLSRARDPEGAFVILAEADGP